MELDLISSTVANGNGQHEKHGTTEYTRSAPMRIMTRTDTSVSMDDFRLSAASSHQSKSKSAATRNGRKLKTLDGAKIVNNGELYKQLFEAEAQLVDALTEVRWIRANKPPAKVIRSLRDTSLPVVRNATNRGMLENRQIAWTKALENDTFTENPVLQRQELEWLRLVEMEPDSSKAASEVADLPDLVKASRSKSNVIERIKEKRKEKHNFTFEEMRQELAQIGLDTEPLVKDRCHQLNQELQDLEKSLISCVAPIITEETLVALSFNQLEHLWVDVSSVFQLRRSAIGQLDHDLHNLEEARVSRIRLVFKNYCDVLERVTHLAPAELHRFIDDEAMMVNQTLLNNKRCYADLHTRLLMSELEKEKKLHHQWLDKIEEWKVLHTDKVTEEFLCFMQSPEIQAPASLDEIYTQMRQEQAEINKKRLVLIEEIQQLVPPAATKTSIQKWNQSMLNLSKTLDIVNQKYMKMIYEDYERICQHSLAQMDYLKTCMVEAGVATAEVADKVVKERCLPLIIQQQSNYEKRLDVLDKKFEKTARRVAIQLKSLYKFFQGSAHLWDRHELALASLERSLVARLNVNRDKHNTENQEREAQLDAVMDRLRQEASEYGLKTQLTRALDILKVIESSYHKFHSEQVQEVRSYPHLVEEEIEQLENGFCDYFGVEREGKKKDSDNEDDVSDKPDLQDPDNLDEVEKKKPKLNVRQGTDVKNESPSSRSPKLSKQSKVKAINVKEEEQEEEWIKQAFREILMTSAGSNFRVLTEAGVHGIPPSEDSGPVKHGYITLVRPDETETEVMEDENISSVFISTRTVLEAKIKIRQNFLDFVDSWRPEAMGRGDSVVNAKTEELEAELRLRLHLHEPRSRRAELDVHNVRAAELVMHSDRVTRHTKGVVQTLESMKTDFHKLNEQHDQLMSSFHSKIESMEEQYISATKSSRLVTLSTQCQAEVDKFMIDIRTSLRLFRQGLDQNLQMLREANARFIKSFKLFSEGGNFCPEEVEDYKKRLDKMSHKVDSAESGILSELEGMEKKRLDSANTKVQQFEDQFRNHMVDLVFMEKMARWLTNSQVKVKSEVADSNSQTHKLISALQSLETRIDACAHPNLDKETVTPNQLLRSLQDLFMAFHDRSIYLNCVGTQKPPPSVVTFSDSVPEGKVVKVDYTDVAPITKSGKQPVEDMSVTTIKKILKTQKARVHGAEVQIDSEKDEPVKSNKPARRGAKTQHQQAAEGSQDNLTGAPASDNTRTASLAQGSVSKMDSTVNRSSQRRNSNVTAQGETGGHRKASASRRYVAKNQRLEKKYMVFGEEDDPTLGSHFLGRVRRVCREALDGMLLGAELYYRQKGSRPVTRPQALHETFDQCAEVIMSKLQVYYAQAEEYHNSCVIDFCKHLERLEKAVALIPPLAIQELTARFNKKILTGFANLQKSVDARQKALDTTRTRHETTLTPGLGHPERAELLASLCNSEKQRHEEALAILESLKQDREKLLVQESGDFVVLLSDISEVLFIQMDNLLTVDDVEKGHTPPDLLSTVELLRRQKAGEPIQDPDKGRLIRRGKANWTGLVLNAFQTGQVPKRAATVVTAKTTLAHHTTEEERQRAFEKCISGCAERLEDVRAQNRDAVTLENRWWDNWNRSVSRIKQLY